MNATAPSAPTGRDLPTVTGRLAEQQGERIILRIPETDYRLHLLTETPIDAEVGDLITGTIHCQARRVDVVPAGGRFIEPIYGRPRRIQGRVIGGDPQQNTLYLRGGAPLVVQLMPSQKAGDFKIGQMVCFDVEAGARFEPA